MIRKDLITLNVKEILDDINDNRSAYEELLFCCNCDEYVRPAIGMTTELENVIIDEILNEVSRRYFKSFTDVRRAIFMELNMSSKYRFTTRSENEREELYRLCSSYELKLKNYIRFLLNSEVNVSQTVFYEEKKEQAKPVEFLFLREIAKELAEKDSQNVLKIEPIVTFDLEANDKDNLIFDFAKDNAGIQVLDVPDAMLEKCDESEIKLYNRLTKFISIVGIDTTIIETPQIYDEIHNVLVSKVDELKNSVNNKNSLSVCDNVLLVEADRVENCLCPRDIDLFWTSGIDEEWYFENENFDKDSINSRKRLLKEYETEISINYKSIGVSALKKKKRKLWDSLDSSYSNHEFEQFLDNFELWSESRISSDDFRMKAVKCPILLFYDIVRIDNDDVIVKQVPLNDFRYITSFLQSSGSHNYYDEEVCVRYNLAGFGKIKIIAIRNPNDVTEVKFQKTRLKCE